VSNRLAWGIIGTGSIARTFAKGVAESRTGTLVAVGSRAQETADAFGDEFEVARRHGRYEALLADEAVQAVYISTPHPMHAEWAIAAAEAGKHILCEKPLALNHADAMTVIEAARRNDVFLMEALMYRCHPQTATLVKLIREGVIGEVRVIQATFSFHASFDPEGRLFNQALGGGGILDVGCYCTSMARLIAGAATAKDVAEPIEVTGCARIGEVSRVDEWAVASLRFPGDILATLATGVRVTQENVVRIFGSEGWILVPEPWQPGRDGGPGRIIVRKGKGDPQVTEVEPHTSLYGDEADCVAEHLDRRQAPPPAMTWNDTLGNMRTLDRWREAIGLVYDAEMPEAMTVPASGRPLARRPDPRMRYGPIEGVDLAVSRLVMGVDNQETMPHAAAMFDDFFERGGNCFDTAYIYGGGRRERLLGQWIKNRAIRDQVVILGKGAHTPHCNPEDLTRELTESLERLQTAYVDIYMLHRDNLDIPVGEFIDVLNEHQSAGRIRAFGASNWTFERVAAANDYAASKRLGGFAAVSNNFSLARMIQPPWQGCLSASDAESRAWFTETQMPLFPWSSQARGFFVNGRADPNDRSDEELVRCWYSDDNFRRLERARELAEKRGVLAINIALAYVLHQPFPTFPLIGPRTIDETRIAFAALDVELTPDEVKWLNTEV